MRLNLSLARGPLADEELDAVGATYGTVDRRYASRDFCRILFNENPLGYSYHAFVRDGDRIVGHYSVIPMRIRARGTTVLSGKGEALFLEAAYREATIHSAAGEVLAGIAMMKSLHGRVLADGIAVIHSITSPAVGMILRMNGSRALKLSLDLRRVVLRTSEGRRFLSRALVERILGFAQRALLAAVRAVLRLTAAPSIEVSPPAHADRHLAALAATDAATVAGWTISRDIETLKWMRRLGRLEVVSITGRPECFAVMTKGDTRELLLWNVPRGAKRTGLAIACALLTLSVREKAHVFSIAHRTAIEGGDSLRFSARLLGFSPKRILMTVYTKSADDFYRERANLQFSRLFNL